MYISGVTRLFSKALRTTAQLRNWILAKSWGAEEVHHWPQDGTKQLCNLIRQSSNGQKLSFFHYPATSCGLDRRYVGQLHLCFINPAWIPSLEELSCLLPNGQDVDEVTPWSVDPVFWWINEDFPPIAANMAAWLSAGPRRVSSASWESKRLSGQYVDPGYIVQLTRLLGKEFRVWGLFLPCLCILIHRPECNGSYTQACAANL